MAITLSAFRVRFPQFASVTEYPGALLDSILQEASRSVSIAFFGARADDAHAYLAAHLATTTIVGAGSGSAAGVKSVSAGSVSITYADAAAGADNDYASTSYGRAYQRLIKLGGRARTTA